jgi:hypothetical protein
MKGRDEEKERIRKEYQDFVKQEQMKTLECYQGGYTMIQANYNIRVLS